jgi:hypothetical protein
MSLAILELKELAISKPGPLMNAYKGDVDVL